MQLYKELSLTELFKMLIQYFKSVQSTTNMLNNLLCKKKVLLFHADDCSDPDYLMLTLLDEGWS